MVWNLTLVRCCIYTVKLARSKLPANAGNFTCSSQVKKSHAQFTCVTCSLPVKTGQFTCVEAASTSRRIHANFLQAHVNLTEYHFTILLVILHAELMQICPRLACKNACFCSQKYMQLAGKNTRIAGENNCKRRKKYPPNAGKINCERRKKYPHNRRQKNLQFHAELPAIAGNMLSHRG